MDGALCARGRRASGCGHCGGSASRDCWISPLKQSTTRHMFACLLRFHGTRHVELDKLLKLNEQIERKSPKRLVKFDAFENDCLKIHFSTNQMQIKLNEINRIELKTNNHSLRRTLSVAYRNYNRFQYNRFRPDTMSQFFFSKTRNF